MVNRLNNNVYKITLAGLLVALGIVLPATFHVVKMGGIANKTILEGEISNGL